MDSSAQIVFVIYAHLLSLYAFIKLNTLMMARKEQCMRYTVVYCVDQIQYVHSKPHMRRTQIATAMELMSIA